MSKLPDVSRVIDMIRAASAPAGMLSKVIAVDGRGGAGKSTLAATLAGELGDIPVVHTDDFASWEEPLEWWPRMVEQVLRPIAAGEIAKFQRKDWGTGKLREWIELPLQPPAILLEGVTSSRSEFDPYLALRIWVETPRELCLQRGLERDGESMRPSGISGWLLRISISSKTGQWTGLMSWFLELSRSDR